MWTVEPALWSERTVGEACGNPPASVRPEWSAQQGLLAMSAAAVDHLPVEGATGRLIGVVGSSEVVRLTQIVEQVHDDPPGTRVTGLR